MSDFHVGKDEYPQLRMFERIIKLVKSNVDAGFIPDFLFITGDLADKGKEGEYEMFNYEFLDPLQKVLGAGIVSRTFAIPGNHDVDQSKHQAFDRQEISDPAKRYFDANDEGKSLREILLPRFKAFADTDCTAPNPTILTYEGLRKLSGQ
ncbi:MAG: metallophosphoesterase [Verrucomicrobiia bacterium]